jgi:hypothetical protein
MPTIVHADIESKTLVSSHRVHLTTYFLSWSLKHAIIAVENQQPHNVSEASISSIIFSALFIEAFIYQLAEDFVDDKEMAEFDRCRKQYKNRSGQKLSNTAWKLRHIINVKADPLLSMDDPLLVKVDAIIQTRHKLIHYKPGENAQKIHRPLPIGHGTITFDFSAPIIEVEPSLVEREATCKHAIKNYMTCRELMIIWHEMIKGDMESVLSQYPPVDFEPKEGGE